MDVSSACRVAVRIPAYHETLADGSIVSHGAKDAGLVVDRDKINLKDLTDDIAELVKLAPNQGLTLTVWNKETKAYLNLTSDSLLMDAIAMYWEWRLVRVAVNIYDTAAVAFSQSVSVDHGDGNELPAGNSVEDHVAGTDLAADTDEADHGDALEMAADTDEADHGDGPEDAVAEPSQADEVAYACAGKKWKEPGADEVPWDEDDEEYVGLHDDEGTLAQENAAHENSDNEFDDVDDLLVDDEEACDEVEHVTNLNDPTIAVGVTFEDGPTFKRAIRHYAVLNEFEIAADYSESTRYRGHCKGSKSKKKKCKWRIHASQLQDGVTWQVMTDLYDIHCTNLYVKLFI